MQNKEVSRTFFSQQREKEVVHLNKVLADKDKQLDKLHLQLNSLTDIGKSIEVEYQHQLRTKNEEINQLSELFSKNNIITQRLQEQLAAKDRRETGYTRTLQRIVGKKHDATQQLVQRLRREITDKEEQLKKLRNVLAERPAQLNEALLAGTDEEITNLSRKLEEKTAELARGEDAALKQEQLYESTIARLYDQLQDRGREMENIKELVAEKDRIMHELTLSFDTIAAEKDATIQKLTSQMTRRSLPSAKHEQVILKLQEGLNVKNEATKVLISDLSSLKKLNQKLNRELVEKQKNTEILENKYAELVESSRTQRERQVKQLADEYAKKELALRTEVEKLRVQMATQKTILGEKQQAIDDVLSRFSEVAKQLVAMRAGGKEMHAPEKAKAAQEDKITKLKEDAEDALEETRKREDDIVRREELLMKEQTALVGEIDVLKKAGLEIRKTTDYLKEKIAQEDVPSIDDMVHKDELPTLDEQDKVQPPQDVQEIKEEAPEPVEKMPLSRAEAPKVAEIKPIPKAEPVKPPSPPSQPGEESFFGPYSEEDEVMPMVEVALQQGDSPDQVIHSLVAAGYTEKVVRNAVKKLKK